MAVLTPPSWLRRPSSLLSLPGAWGALAGALATLTPSLLPRSALVQGVLTGIGAAIGYGVGTVVAYWGRELAGRDRRSASPRSWRVLVVAAVVLGLGGAVAGWAWQLRIRELMGMPSRPAALAVLVPPVAVAVFLLLFALGRVIRAAYRAAARGLGRLVGPRAARVLGWTVVAIGVTGLLSGVVYDGALAAADRAFAVRDTTTADGVVAPRDPARSGAPGSLVAWDSLGRQGRSFAAGGPSRAELAAFGGDPAPTTIRAYAGIATAADLEDRARIAVDDLERAGGFERAHLLVATATGTGWLDPGAMSAFEYVTGGDSAIVSLQYSHLPSVVSYLVDQTRARAAGRALFDAVYERWVALPTGSRPRLYVFGESLGSFGAEGAFSGEFDLRTRTDGALFVGAPGFNWLHLEFTTGRDAPSPAVEPVYRGGRTVRFASDLDSGIPPVDADWSDTRVLYVQHPSDPIVWWSPRLILSRPDWLREPRGRDVLPQVVWLPFITFWQVTLDLPFAVEVPDGHGHRYTRESVDAWAAIVQPEGWTAARAEELRALIGG